MEGMEDAPQKICLKVFVLCERLYIYSKKLKNSDRCRERS